MWFYFYNNWLGAHIFPVLIINSKKLVFWIDSVIMVRKQRLRLWLY